VSADPIEKTDRLSRGLPSGGGDRQLTNKEAKDLENTIVGHAPQRLSWQVLKGLADMVRKGLPNRQHFW
jgi:hypothetical protein